MNRHPLTRIQGIRSWHKVRTCAACLSVLCYYDWVPSTESRKAGWGWYRWHKENGLCQKCGAEADDATETRGAWVSRWPWPLHIFFGEFKSEEQLLIEALFPLGESTDEP